jgi:hypothetical protein
VASSDSGVSGSERFVVLPVFQFGYPFAAISPGFESGGRDRPWSGGIGDVLEALEVGSGEEGIACDGAGRLSPVGGCI